MCGESCLLGKSLLRPSLKAGEFASAFVSWEHHTVPIHREELKQHVTPATHAAVPTECGPLPVNCEQDELGGIP